MHQVYRNSYCNIALVHSRNSKGGAFGKRNPRDVAPVRYIPKQDSARFGHKPWSVLAEDLWDRELLAPLYVRGWVFQGRMSLENELTGHSCLRNLRTHVVTAHPPLCQKPGALGLSFVECLRDFTVWITVADGQGCSVR